jgi:hypothetical protein
LLYTAPEILFGEPFRTFLPDRGERRGAQQRYEQEIIEVTRLQRSVLPIVCEAEELALVCRNRTRGPIHPA